MPAADVCADVCIVGAGPAGITLARALGRTGHRVTLLESGSGVSAPLDQALNDGDVVGEPYAGLQRTRARDFGGSANIWDVEIGSKPGAKYAPLDACDVRTWPLAWKELEPFYASAQDVCGLGQFAYEAADWQQPGLLPFDVTGTGLTSRVYQFGSAERFTQALRDELQQLDGVRILTSCTVTALLLDRSRQRVLGVRVAGASGTLSDIQAPRVVLACGAVENARLLLMAGVGEHAQWLGRGFMEHARDFSVTLVPDSPELFARAAFYDLNRASCGTLFGGRLSLRAESIDRLDIPNAAITLIPREGNSQRPSVLHRVLRRVSGASSHKRSRYGWSRQPGRVFTEFGMVLNLEQRPDAQNRIALSTRHDRFGNPLPLLSLKWSDEEQARLDRLRDCLAEWFRGAGLGTLRFERGRRPDLSAHHHAGTTRMATHEHNGVVDAHGAVFGVENLYVSGGSVMPTAGFANPTLTIVALALRLAQHLGGR